MNVTFTIEIALERTQGKFAARDEIVDLLREQIEDAAGEGVYGVGADGDSEYEVTELNVTESAPAKV